MSLYHVSTTGSKVAGTSTPGDWTNANCYSTIASAIALMVKGDTLRIKSGTYSEALNISNKDGTAWTSGNYYYVRSDDGSGNYGSVVIGGTIGGLTFKGLASTANLVFGSDYWWFDHITFTGTASQDISLLITETYSDPSTNKGIGVKLTGCTVNGNPAHQLFSTFNMDGVIYTGNTFSSTGCRGHDQDGFMVGISHINNSATADQEIDTVTVQGNIFTGTYKNEYGCMFFFHCKDVDFPQNYMYNISGSHVCYRYGAGGTFRNNYNNVHSLGGANFQTTEIFHLYWMRGTTTSGGAPQVGAFYNNTIDKNGATWGSEGWGVFRFDDDPTNITIQNNLLIGNWGGDSCEAIIYQYYGGSGPYCANNIARNNQVTGSIPATYGWIRNNQGNDEDCWTLTNNTSSVGSAFINLSGDSPNPYYDLSASRNGTSLGTIPTTDYNGDARTDPPDVGAFEEENQMIFDLIASDYIAASGENTTAQLIAPAGKNSGTDFQAGRIQDDENPTDPVMLDDGKYNENEWCVYATDEAVVDETYRFRLVKTVT